MSERNRFNWVNFYEEFALKLLEYKDSRAELIEKVKSVFKMAGIKLPTLERENNIVDIDPFTVFALFNKNIKDENRIKILKAISELFDVVSEIPTSFDGLPLLTPQNATFYYFIGDREDNDINNLWGFFESALAYVKDPSEIRRKDFSDYFDLAINIKGNGNSKITMGLYWISPDTFLNFDSRNEWYIYKSGKIPVDIVKQLPLIKSKFSAKEYLMIGDCLKSYLNSSRSVLKDFKELSFDAWNYSEQVNRDKKKEKNNTKISFSFADDEERLNLIYEDEKKVDLKEFEKAIQKYNKDDFLSEVYMQEEEYDNLATLLKKKKNLILQGAPGVGKTFVAKRLAYSIMGVKDIDRVMMVQFHQSYSYEDFIMGYRPTKNSFELKNGAFYNFCKKAEIDEKNDYFFIIDEINRGNLSKIFGELFMLIENDKRGQSLQLLYSDERFSIPKNIYIIGMMNTADRSLAMLDYALRRRFSFYDIKPGFVTDGFIKYRNSLKNDKFNRLIECVKSLNDIISSDESLGDGFCIGHSYLCNLSKDKIDDKVLSGIVEYELIPLLKEYWFDEPSKVNNWIINLRSAIK